MNGMNGLPLSTARRTTEHPTATGVTAVQEQGLHIVRTMRAAIVNLNVYPRGHRMVQECLDLLYERFCALLEMEPKVTIELKDHGSFDLNGVALARKGAEREFSAWAVQHFHDRGVKTILLSAGLKKEELDAFLELMARDPNTFVEQPVSKGIEALGIEHIETKSYLLSEEGAARPVIVGIGEGDAPEVEVQLSSDSLARLVRRPEFQEAIERLPARPFLFEQFQKYLLAALRQFGLQVPKFVQKTEDPSILFQGLHKLDDKIATSQEAARLIRTSTHTKFTSTSPYEDATITALHCMLRSIEAEGSDTLKEWAAEGIGELTSMMPPATLARFLGKPISGKHRDPDGTIQGRLLPSVTQDPRRLSQLQEELLELSERTSKRDEYAHLVDILTRTAQAHIEKGDLDGTKKVVETLERHRRTRQREEVRREAERGLHTLAGTDLLPQLVESLRKDPNAGDLSEMLVAIGGAALERLVTELKESPDILLQNVLIDVISRICIHEAELEGSTKPFHPLMRQLREKNLPLPFICNLLKIFGRIGHRYFEASIIEFAHHRHPQIEGEAIRALSALRSPKALQVLREKVLGGRIRERSDLSRAINRLAEAAMPDFPEVVEKLLSGNPGLDIQMTAIQGLGRLPEEMALPLLERIATKKKVLSRKPVYPLPMRLAAVRALGELGGGRARDLLTHLWDIESDPKMLDAIDLALSRKHS